MPKKEAKKLKTEFQALEMYFIKEEKRNHIAKTLKLEPQKVTEIVS